MKRINIFAMTDYRQPGLGACHVINRKKYDTETADLEWKKIYDDDDLCQTVGIALFRKKNGEYFKYETLFARCSATEWIEPTLSPLTENQAKDLTEKYSPEDYEDIFGEVEE